MSNNPKNVKVDVSKLMKVSKNESSTTKKQKTDSSECNGPQNQDGPSIVIPESCNLPILEPKECVTDKSMSFEIRCVTAAERATEKIIEDYLLMKDKDEELYSVGMNETDLYIYGNIFIYIKDLNKESYNESYDLLQHNLISGILIQLFKIKNFEVECKKLDLPRENAEIIYQIYMSDFGEKLKDYTELHIEPQYELLMKTLIRSHMKYYDISKLFNIWSKLYNNCHEK